MVTKMPKMLKNRAGKIPESRNFGKKNYGNSEFSVIFFWNFSEISEIPDFFTKERGTSGERPRNVRGTSEERPRNV